MKASFKEKQDWGAAYVAPNPVLYRNELMGRCSLHEKNRALLQLFDRELLNRFATADRNQPPLFIDLLSAYGDCLLAMVHGMSPEQIFDAWSTEEKSLDLKPRRFRCETVGVDLSENALKYGKTARIFDRTVCVNINELQPNELKELSSLLASADVVHSGAPGYMSLDSFKFTVDAFRAGTSSGWFLASINSLFMESHQEYKQYLLDQLEFVDCIAGLQRHLLPDEKEHYGVESVYANLWLMARPNIQEGKL